MSELYKLGNLKRYYCKSHMEILKGINPLNFNYKPFKFRKRCYYRGNEYKFILFFYKNDFKVIIKRIIELPDGTETWVRVYKPNLKNEQDLEPQSWNDLIPSAKIMITELVIHYYSEINHMLSLNLIKS